MKKAPNSANRPESPGDLRIVQTPGTCFTPEELESLADLVATMILENIRSQRDHKAPHEHGNDNEP